MKAQFPRTLLGLLFPVLLIIVIFPLQQKRLAGLMGNDQSQQNLEQQVQSTAATLSLMQRLPSLGFENLTADWIFLQFLQYFGDDESRSKTGYSLSPEFFEAIIPRDPYYRPHYLFLSNSTSNSAGMPEESVALIAQGLEQLSPNVPADSFYIWNYRAVDELLFLGDSESAQNSYQTAADWARQSSHGDAAFMATRSQETADFLKNNPTSKRAQISAWGSVLANAFDDATRVRAIERIEALGGTVTLNEEGAIQISYPEGDS